MNKEQKTKNKLTLSDIKKIAELRFQGVSLRTIGSVVGCSQTTVANTLEDIKEMGLKLSDTKRSEDK